MSKEYALGKQLEVEGEAYRVVRIVQNSQSLHTSEDKKEYVLEESYLELKSAKGEIEFIALHSEQKPYEGEASKITAPALIPWKRGE